MDLHFSKSLDWEICFCFPNLWQRVRCRWLLDLFFPFPLRAFDDRVVNFQTDLRKEMTKLAFSFDCQLSTHKASQTCFPLVFWSQFALIHCSGTRIWVFQLTDPKSSPCPRAWKWAFQYRPNLGMEQWPWDWKARFFLKGAGSKQDWIPTTWGAWEFPYWLAHCLINKIRGQQKLFHKSLEPQPPEEQACYLVRFLLQICGTWLRILSPLLPYHVAEKDMWWLGLLLEL